MDQDKFADLVRQFPQVWDRNHPHFRDKSIKDGYWDEIGRKCGSTGAAAKELFKALREKYLRELEKSKQFGNLYVPWQLLECLNFLEPHIVRRNQTVNYATVQEAEELSSSIEVQNDLTCSSQDFETNLIQLVKKSEPIWNRKSKSFSSKQLKQELWKNIARKLNKNIQHCVLRWKALREKYIRQKIKYQEGEGKWYLLDQMTFLDDVIQYRRKQSDRESESSQNENSMFTNFYDNSNTYEAAKDISKSHDTEVNNRHFDPVRYEHENSNEFPVDFPVLVKQEQDDIPDSSNDAKNVDVNRKRSYSSTSETERSSKSPKVDDHGLNQEQLFGNLVALMLSKKNEKDKNIAMVEIMKVLTK